MVFLGHTCFSSHLGYYSFSLLKEISPYAVDIERWVVWVIFGELEHILKKYYFPPWQCGKKNTPLTLQKCFVFYQSELWGFRGKKYSLYEDVMLGMQCVQMLKKVILSAKRK